MTVRFMAFPQDEIVEALENTALPCSSAHPTTGGSATQDRLVAPGPVDRPQAQQFLAACTGGHFMLPKEQNTQQSPAIGLSIL
jgi:hypothetical protein